MKSRLLSRFTGNESGVLTVEFAVIAPLLVLLLALCLETARVQIVSALLERSVYDIAFQAKVARGSGFDGIVADVLARRNNALFSPQEVSVTATWAPSVLELAAGGSQGAGGPGDFVRLEMNASLNLFGSLVPKPLQFTRSITYCYVNETDLEADE